MRLKYNISYNGKYLNGWHGGKEGIFIKSLLENAFFKVTGENVEFFCSGRTDAGVHGLNQVCHCDFSGKLSPFKIKLALNYYLPEFIRIKNCEEVSEEFHARFSTKQRIYVYKCYVNPIANPLLENLAFRLNFYPNIEKMKEVMKKLTEKQYDYSTFVPKKYTGLKIRTMDECYIEIENNFYEQQVINFIFKAQSFAHHQIRNLTSGIIQVGQNKWTVNEFFERMNKLDPLYGSNMMPSFGLYLFDCKY